MANKIKYGLRNVYYAVATEGEGGVLTYGTPVRIPGAVNMSIDPEGETNPFYADDIIYYQSNSNNGYAGTLEVALLPSSFYTDILGEIEDDNDVVFEKASATGKEFALLFEFQGDESATRHAFYRCSAQRPPVTGNTKEAGITPQTETLNITVMPRISDYIVKSRCPASATQYNSWFSTVYSAPVIAATT